MGFFFSANDLVLYDNANDMLIIYRNLEYNFGGFFILNGYAYKVYSYKKGDYFGQDSFRTL